MKEKNEKEKQMTKKIMRGTMTRKDKKGEKDHLGEKG